MSFFSCPRSQLISYLSSVFRPFGGFAKISKPMIRKLLIIRQNMKFQQIQSQISLFGYILSLKVMKKLKESKGGLGWVCWYLKEEGEIHAWFILSSLYIHVDYGISGFASCNLSFQSNIFFVEINQQLFLFDFDECHQTCMSSANTSI